MTVADHIRAPKHLVIYGAGNVASFELAIVKKRGLLPVCFCDVDINKQGAVLSGLPVLSVEQAITQFGEPYFWIPETLQLTHNVIEYLLNDLKIDKKYILNYADFEVYRGCSLLESEIVIKDDFIQLCCSQLDSMWGTVPKVYWKDCGGSIDATVTQYKVKRNELINAIKHEIVSTCEGCSQIKTAYFPTNKKVRIASIGFRSPCQLLCNYCSVRDDVGQAASSDMDYRLIFDSFEKKGLLSEDASVGLASGELSIYHKSKELLAAVEKYRVLVASNAVVFRDDIAKAVSRPGSTIMVSVDSGTANTYRAIKSFDYFWDVWANLKKYREAGANVIAKYIFVAENSNEEDVNGFIERAAEIHIKKIYISGDLNKAGSHTDEQIRLMAKMYTLALKNSMTPVLLETIAKEDRARVHVKLNRQAEESLE